jgi:hypothetical protein
MMDLMENWQMQPSVLEYILDLGMKGKHLLFENQIIREAFQKNNEELADLGSERVGELRRVLREIFQIPDLEGKKDYISTLPEDTQHVLIFLYFQIVEKNVMMNQNRPH